MDILVEELEGSLWVAAVHKGRLEGLEIDPVSEEVRWGSIYWGKVMHIDKAMDAAYIDLDGDNSGILHNADVRIIDSNGNVKKGGSEDIGKLLTPGQMVAVQAKTGYLPPLENDSDLPLENKAPKLSMDITLQGRFLIYTSMAPENRISSRIRDKKLRKQLTKMLDSIEKIKGCILRAAAAYTQTDILIREANILNSVWQQVKQYFNGDSPQLIMLGPDAVQRVLSDMAGKRIDRVEITTMDRYQEVEEWCEVYAPDLVTKVTPVELEDHSVELGLFDHRDILDQIEDLFRPYILMTGGASIIVQDTAAMTVIDVNRGASKASNLEINLDAADEIARHLRLRNQGGIIVIDFLKMKSKAEEDSLLAALEKAFDDDPCTTQLHGMTALGLVEVTRKRRTPPLQDRFDSAIEP